MIEQRPEIVSAASETNPAEQNRLAKVAFDYFIAASMRCPGSPTGQASLIAMRLQESGENPSLLDHALRSDRNRLNEIAELAHHYHTSRESGPQDISVVYDQLGPTIAGDFAMAQRMQVLDRSVLRRVSTELYQRYMKPGSEMDDTTRYRREDAFKGVVNKEIKRELGRKKWEARRNQIRNWAKRIGVTSSAAEQDERS